MLEFWKDFMENEVTVSGWVRSNRDSKSFGFLTISDGTFFTPLQVVLIGLVLIFKGNISKLMNNIFKEINKKSKEVYN